MLQIKSSCCLQKILVFALKLGEVVGTCKYGLGQRCVPALRNRLIPLFHVAISNAPPTSSNLAEELYSIPARTSPVDAGFQNGTSSPREGTRNVLVRGNKPYAYIIV